MRKELHSRWWEENGIEVGNEHARIFRFGTLTLSISLLPVRHHESKILRKFINLQHFLDEVKNEGLFFTGDRMPF